ncbi:MAG: fumarate reductase subunit C [Armatimonadetes bacterium]|nr:fumarate reductase subunit C [Armatimonadota bacterium]
MKPPLNRNMGSTWWLSRGAYFLIMLRELSAVFIAAYLVFFLICLYKVGQGPEAYGAYLRFLWSPGMILFHLVALAFALLHMVTWFNATPKAVRVWRGEERVPPALMIGPNYAVWAVITAFIIWVVLK